MQLSESDRCRNRANEHTCRWLTRNPRPLGQRIHSCSQLLGVIWLAEAVCEFARDEQEARKLVA
jgi:hypothetical protein